MIKALNIEVTTLCNGDCRFCPRKYFGSKYELPKLYLDIDKFIDLDVNSLPDLKKITFCGSFGEPTLHPSMFRLINSIDDRIELYIHTNGATRMMSWWRLLGALLKDRKHYVVFGIDGLTPETHEMYRKTNFHKIIDNMQMFIRGGGNARVQFFVFKHNEHQLAQAKSFFESLGCKDVQFRLSRKYDDVLEKPASIKDVKSKEEYIKAKARHFCFTEMGEYFIDTDAKIFVCCYDYNNYFVKKHRNEEIKPIEMPFRNFDNAVKSLKARFIKELPMCDRCRGYEGTYIK